MDAEALDTPYPYGFTRRVSFDARGLDDAGDVTFELSGELVKKGIEAAKTQLGPLALKAAGDLIGSNKLTDAVNGAMMGASYGAALGPIGAGIGAVCGAIIGGIGFASGGPTTHYYDGTLGPLECIYTRREAKSDPTARLMLGATQASQDGYCDTFARFVELITVSALSTYKYPERPDQYGDTKRLAERLISRVNVLAVAQAVHDARKREDPVNFLGSHSEVGPGNWGYDPNPVEFTMEPQFASLVAFLGLQSLLEVLPPPAPPPPPPKVVNLGSFVDPNRPAPAAFDPNGQPAECAAAQRMADRNRPVERDLLIAKCRAKGGTWPIPPTPIVATPLTQPVAGTVYENDGTGTPYVPSPPTPTPASPALGAPVSSTVLVLGVGAAVLLFALK